MSISAAEVRDAIDDPGREVAVVDVSEVEDFRPAHLYLAAYLPASWTDARHERVRALVPRQDTLVVLVGPDGVVEEEAARWRQWGYSNARVLAGGTGAWVAAGERAFRNLCVPSKALAETARLHYDLPATRPEELFELLRSDRPPLVVDARSPEEYADATIPGAVGLPGGELAARILSGVTDPDQQVVVTCGGRTRSLFGAASLRDAGIPNPVSWLDGGTNAWHDAGFELEHGAHRHGLLLADPTTAQRIAATLTALAHPTFVDGAAVRDLVADRSRTTYVIDPRLEPGQHGLTGVDVRHVPAGHLVEAIDECIPVLRARVVLVDEAPHVHALAIARWLRASRQFEVFVFDPDLGTTPGVAGIPGAPPRPALAADAAAAAVDPDYRQWSTRLPGLAAAEPGGGFAL